MLKLSRLYEKLPRTQTITLGVCCVVGLLYGLAPLFKGDPAQYGVGPTDGGLAYDQRVPAQPANPKPAPNPQAAEDRRAKEKVAELNRQVD